jgi:hypothetical protein
MLKIYWSHLNNLLKVKESNIFKKQTTKIKATVSDINYQRKIRIIYTVVTKVRHI